MRPDGAGRQVAGTRVPVWQVLRARDEAEGTPWVVGGQLVLMGAQVAAAVAYATAFPDEARAPLPD